MVQVPGVQPMCTIDDALEAESIILNDPIIANLVKERYGITDVKSQLVADPWYYGARNEEQEEAGGRIMTAFMYIRNGPLDNHYAHPLDLYVHLDMTAKKVLHDRCFMHKQVSLFRPLSSDMSFQVRRSMEPGNFLMTDMPRVPCTVSFGLAQSALPFAS